MEKAGRTHMEKSPHTPWENGHVVIILALKLNSISGKSDNQENG